MERYMQSDKYEYIEEEKIIKYHGTNRGDEKIFKYVMTIEPIKDEKGEIKRRPKYSAGFRKEFEDNSYYFCEFKLEDERWMGQCGIYLWFIKNNDKNNRIIYVGRTTDLYQRFNSRGYGKISSSNCKAKGGQYTNCKMNHEVYEIYANNDDKKIDIYFFKIEDIEAEMIKVLRPEKNEELKSDFLCN